jgi:hypothetical protein
MGLCKALCPVQGCSNPQHGCGKILPCPDHDLPPLEVPAKKQPHDPVVNYYRWHPGGFQAKDVTGAFPTNLGAAINYIWRAAAPPDVRKPGTDRMRDLNAAIDHLRFEIERIEKGESK